MSDAAVLAQSPAVIVFRPRVTNADMYSLIRPNMP